LGPELSYSSEDARKEFSVPKSHFFSSPVPEFLWFFDLTVNFITAADSLSSAEPLSKRVPDVDSCSKSPFGAAMDFGVDFYYSSHHYSYSRASISVFTSEACSSPVPEFRRFSDLTVNFITGAHSLSSAEPRSRRVPEFNSHSKSHFCATMDFGVNFHC
jgi:hypothetical protein